jgi:hypothetical protein
MRTGVRLQIAAFVEAAGTPAARGPPILVRTPVVGRLAGASFQTTSVPPRSPGGFVNWPVNGPACERLSTAARLR